MSEQKLEACPFCGDGARLVKEPSASGLHDWWFVECVGGKDVDCAARSQGFGLKIHAAQAWNRRAERPGWRTMESAPRFGHVILFDPKWGVCEGNRGDDGWALATFNGTIKQANPTLWQPLPDSPALHPPVAEGRQPKDE